MADLFKRILHDKAALVCLIMLSVFVLTAIGAEIYACCVKEPAYKIEHIQSRFESPSLQHVCGTDYLGRDVFLRLIRGSSTAFKVGVIATLISIIIGVALGMTAGYFGGRTDDMINGIYAVFAAMPTMLFILCFALLCGKGFLFDGADAFLKRLARDYGIDTGMIAVYLGIGLTGWVSLCKVVRAESMKLRETPFIQAAKLCNIPARHILWRHILPNVAHIVIIYAGMRFGYAVMTEVIVSYLGLGVSLEPSWGTMIAEGQQNLWQGQYWEVLFATIAIFLVVLPLNILGDRLRDFIDVKGGE